MTAVKSIHFDEIAALSGVPLGAAEAAFGLFVDHRPQYRTITSEERRQAIAELEAATGDRSLRVVGGDESAIWDAGWQEVAHRLKTKRITLDALRPQYFRDGNICRVGGDLVWPLSPDFEYWMGVALRGAIFNAYLSSRPAIVELGCGTGLNILMLSKMCPQSRLIGSDWSRASMAILDQIGLENGTAVEGRLLNLLTLDGWIGEDITDESAILTVHALEQLGDGWGPLVDALLVSRPGLCVHIEPLLELYDDRHELDVYARRYHVKRNYLQGFVPHMRKLEQEGRVHIVALRRVQFGGLYHEAYSIMVWRPI